MTLFSTGLERSAHRRSRVRSGPGLGGAGRLLDDVHAVSTDNAYLQGDITPISPKISGYIAEVAIHDNQAVKAGDVLFRIDARDYQARVDQAAAGVATRRAALDNLASRIEFQQASIERAVATLNGAEANADRAIARFRPRPRADRERLGLAGEAGSGGSRSSAGAGEGRRSKGRPRGRAAAAGRAGKPAPAAAGRHRRRRRNARRLAADRSRRHRCARTVRRPGRRAAGQARTICAARHARAGNRAERCLGRRQLQGNADSGAACRRQRDGVRRRRPGRALQGRIDSFSPASGAKFALLPPDNATGNFTRIVQRIPVKITLMPGQPELDDLRPGMSAVVKLISASRESKPRSVVAQAKSRVY